MRCVRDQENREKNGTSLREDASWLATMMKMMTMTYVIIGLTGYYNFLGFMLRAYMMYIRSCALVTYGMLAGLVLGRKAS